jgi:hypothetical protein
MKPNRTLEAGPDNPAACRRRIAAIGRAVGVVIASVSNQDLVRKIRK